MSEEEKKAIETLKEVASDDFDTLGDDISPKMAQNILNVIDNQQKEIEELKTNLEKFEVSFALSVKDRDSKAETLKNSISKDKIREKMKELEEIGHMLKNEQGYWGSPKLLNQMEILKELLEENSR